MTSDPALKQLAAHRAIHDAGQAQAENLLADLVTSFKEKSSETFQIALQLATLWEERIVPHADAEDEGLYQELLQADTISKQQIYMLMRDHDLLRKITFKAKEQLLKQQRVTDEVIHLFHTLLILNAIHHKEEEETLFHN